MTAAEALAIVAQARQDGTRPNLPRADLRGADLSDARLTGADLSGADLSGADLRGAQLTDADLSGANLSGANLSRANLTGANLTGADLSGADLSDTLAGGGNTAGIITGRPIDPALPLRIARKVLAKPSCLDMDDWHTCNTRHCLAGWAIHLTGAKGYDLERDTSPGMAGLLLAPSLAPYFYSDNDEALEVLRGIVAAADAAA